MDITRLKVRVDALHDEAQGIRSFSISRMDGRPFDAYQPGAHIDVTSPAGITRQYSLCGDPDRCDAQRFAVKKEQTSRGGSRSLHDDVVTGMELSVSAPRNLFQLVCGAGEHILIAAGIGITPLLSMAYRLVRQRVPSTCTISPAVASRPHSSRNCPLHPLQSTSKFICRCPVMR